MLSYIGCLGKIRSYAEFIRLEAMHPEVGAWDEWLQEGLAAGKRKYPAGLDGRYTTGRELSFVWKPNGSSTALIGHSVPSQDKAGRLYPFTVFAGVNAADGSEKLACLALAFSRQLESMPVQEWQDSSAALAWVSNFATRFSPPGLLLAEINRPVQDVPLLSPPGTGLELAFNLKAVAESLSGTASTTLGYGLGFKINSESPDAASLALSAGMSRRILSGLGQPYLILWTDRPNALLLIFYGRPPAAVYPGAVLGEDMSDDVFWLSSNGGADLALIRSQLPKKLVDLMDHPTTMIADILEIL